MNLPVVGLGAVTPGLSWGYLKSQFSKIFQESRALLGQRLTDVPISPKTYPEIPPRRALRGSAFVWRLLITDY